MKRKFFIDCQILQTNAFDRGMGKYSLSFLEALTKNPGFSKTYDPVLIMNTNLPLTTERLKNIEKHTGKATILKINLPVDISTEYQSKIKAAQQRLTQEIASHLNRGEAADFLLLAPFFVAFPSVFPELTTIRKSCIVYDIIPHLIWHRQRIFPDDIYFQHYRLFVEADELFTISGAVKSDLTRIVGIDKSKITSINGGPFHTGEARVPTELPKRPYILYPSAPIFHKNNQNAVKGFTLFNRKNQNLYRLVFTSTFDSKTQTELAKLSPGTIFTGNVSDQELTALYKNCETVLFASLAEGLGMPVLEGVMHDKPVACSDITVFTEMSKDAFYLFNPLKPNEIAQALGHAVHKHQWPEKHALYPEIRSEYQWPQSAESFMRKLKISKSVIRQRPKRKLLIICPYPNLDLPAARFIEKLYAQLAAKYDTACSFYRGRGKPVPSYVAYVAQRKNNEGTKPDAVLFIGGKYNKRLLTAYYDSIPTLCITVTSRRKLRLKSFTRLPQNVKQLSLTANKVFVNELLQVTGWEYMFHGRKLDSADILSNLEHL